MSVWRPADGNEVSAAYISAIEGVHHPTVIALTRQGVPHLEHSSIEKALKGAYTVWPQEKPNIIIVSSGSEVSISIDAAKELERRASRPLLFPLPISSLLTNNQLSTDWKFCQTVFQSYLLKSYHHLDGLNTPTNNLV